MHLSLEFSPIVAKFRIRPTVISQELSSTIISKEAPQKSITWEERQPPLKSCDLLCWFYFCSFFFFLNRKVTRNFQFIPVMHEITKWQEYDPVFYFLFFIGHSYFCCHYFVWGEKKVWKQNKWLTILFQIMFAVKDSTVISVQMWIERRLYFEQLQKPFIHCRQSPVIVRSPWRNEALLMSSSYYPTCHLSGRDPSRLPSLKTKLELINAGRQGCLFNSTDLIWRQTVRLETSQQSNRIAHLAYSVTVLNLSRLIRVPVRTGN